jgi:hypothetical protein
MANRGEDRAWDDYIGAFKRDILPSLLSSAFMLSIGTTPDPETMDLRAATEIGLMLLLDKPLLLVILPGEAVPAALIRAASGVVTVSGTDAAADQALIAAAVREMVEGRGDGGPEAARG